MKTEPEANEQTPVEMPDVTYAVLGVEGSLAFKSVPSRAVRKDKVLYQHGPWEAAEKEIGGPCRRLDRTDLGSGLIAWVSDISLLRSEAYPENVIGGRTARPLEDEQRWLIREAHRAARGDSGSVLYDDDLDLLDDPLDWRQEPGWKAAYTAFGPDGAGWYLVNPGLEEGRASGQWGLCRSVSADPHPVVVGYFDSLEEAFKASQVLARSEVAA